MKTVLVAVSACLFFTFSATAQWNNAGPVGIGTTTPGAILETKTVTNGDKSLRLRAAGYGFWDLQAAYINTNPDLNFAPNGGSATVTFAASGNVGIGTTVPAQRLTIMGADYQSRVGLYAFPGSGSTDVRNWGLLISNWVYGDFAIMQSTSRDADPMAGTARLYIKNDGAVGIGTTAPSDLLTVGPAGGTGNKLTVNGDITVTGNVAAKYQDVAEWVPVAEEMPAGTVVVVSGSTTNTVGPSQRAYDTRVAGVVSIHPGLTLGEGSSTKAQIATTGRVRVRVDATKHAISLGDLLVTSDRPGMAMKSEPLDLGGVKIHRPGTLIGKALEPLPSGKGEILVLLSLQ